MYFLLGVLVSVLAVVTLFVWQFSAMRETYRKSVVTDYLIEAQAWERDTMKGVLLAYTNVIDKQKTLIEQHIQATPLLSQTVQALPQHTSPHTHTHAHTDTTHQKLVFLPRLGYTWEKRDAKNDDDYDTMTLIGPNKEFMYEAFGYEFLNTPIEVGNGLYIKTCVSCGGVYPAKNSTSQTCGDKCRTKKMQKS